MPVGTVHIGTSGWSYAHWRNRFYPRGVKAADWLAYLASWFDTTEINGSFYRIPQPKTVDAWVRQVPEDFHFAVKLWRGITHYRKLVQTQDFLKRFFDVMNRIPHSQRGPLLVQLPPQLKCDLSRLEAFLQEFRETTADEPWRMAVEFRHPAWQCPEAAQLLNRYGAALCLHDMQGRAESHSPNQVDFVYLRRHGSSAQAEGCYTEKEIADDARRIGTRIRAGKTVFVYYNNDLGAHAVRNAWQLQSLLKSYCARHASSENAPV